jgi:hypothetical protein
MGHATGAARSVIGGDLRRNHAGDGCRGVALAVELVVRKDDSQIRDGRGRKEAGTVSRQRPPRFHESFCTYNLHKRNACGARPRVLCIFLEICTERVGKRPHLIVLGGATTSAGPSRLAIRVRRAAEHQQPRACRRSGQETSGPARPAGNQCALPAVARATQKKLAQEPVSGDAGLRACFSRSGWPGLVW